MISLTGVSEQSKHLTLLSELTDTKLSLNISKPNHNMDDQQNKHHEEEELKITKIKQDIERLKYRTKILEREIRTTEKQ